MKCPHCLVEFHRHSRETYIGEDIEGEWWLEFDKCPRCERLVLSIVSGESEEDEYGNVLSHTENARYLARPRAISRSPLPAEVPERFAQDYREASLVLADSPKASAALGRRCLQNLLREKGGVQAGDLSKEIQQVIDGGQLPSGLAESIDAVRNIGNFAAHPMKGQSTGEVVPVEVGEAEWNLEVLEELFDFYFVRPARLEAKREALNAKLAEAGKPPMKSPPQKPSDP